jgi:hypothetical protein
MNVLNPRVALGPVASEVACDRQAAPLVVGKRYFKTIHLQTPSAMTRFLLHQYSRRL